MTAVQEHTADRVPLSRSQQSMYNGALQNDDPALYLIAKRYRLHPRELSGFLASLEAMITGNPVQLCVLQPPRAEGGYPDFVLRLRFEDLVRVQQDSAQHDSAQHDKEGAAAHDGELMRSWFPDILAKPLVRYTVRTDEGGFAVGLDIHAHHILLDGGAIRAIEADLARSLANECEAPRVGDAMAKLAAAHRRETEQADKAAQRFAEAVRNELVEAARNSGHGRGPDEVRATAAKGALRESVRIAGTTYDAILALAEKEQTPLNALVAAAATAVSASLRQSTESFLAHAVDNRFGDHDLDVATCLVNSVAHPFSFPVFASTQAVVRALDREYVTALRRRWFREEQYRRAHATINQAACFEALTLNFIREPCAASLRPFLSQPPVVTAIGPVEGMTVACVQDEEGRALELSVWASADAAEEREPPGVAERIAKALELLPSMWQRPIAMTVGEWFRIGEDGARSRSEQRVPAERQATPAWFLDTRGGVQRYLQRRRHVDGWVAWLTQSGIATGDVVVLADDDTDKTVDLLVACHLAGCGYSVCDSFDDTAERAGAIIEHSGAGAHVVDVAAVHLTARIDDDLRQRIAERREQVTGDAQLADKTAYIMPTSGSTGLPKLVRVSHGSLALFCDAIRRVYGWKADDRVLQCAPLTSDISVEEVFGGAICGSDLVRTDSMKTGDLQALARDLVAQDPSEQGPTILDVPTAVWHLLCDDGDALGALARSHLRQIVIGGEALRSGAVDKWVDSGAWKQVSLVSTYGPTETTVVVTALPITCDRPQGQSGAVQRRLGRPIIPDTVFVAFGEVVVVGDMVSSGYLGIDDRGFGSVSTADGSPRRAFATADRVAFDREGFPVLRGRRDAVVKIAGKRVDTAVVMRRVAEDPAVSDVCVAAHSGRLGVWIQTRLTREGSADPAGETRVRSVLAGLGVSSFFVIGVPRIPRKPNGKIDNARLPSPSQQTGAVLLGERLSGRAAELAQIWSRHLGRTIGPDSSLLDEGVGSLDLIRLLPDTRAHLRRQLSVLDLISAGTARQLANTTHTDALLGAETQAQVAHDLDSLRRRPMSPRAELTPDGGGGTIVLLGASGVFGTGFAQAVLDLKQAHALCPEVVLVARSRLPERDPWTALRGVDGVRIEHASFGFSLHELDELIRETGARTIVNSIGNTNMLARYRELWPANVEVVSSLAEACANRGTRLVHLSTFGVSAPVDAPRAIDPRAAVYPYAAAKSLAELAVAGAGAPHGLGFSLVRLPRVLGTEYQTRDSTDILVSMVEACAELRAYPCVTLTEEVTTGYDAARRVLSQVLATGGAAGTGGSTGPGRGIIVVRGQKVAYTELLGEYATEELGLAEWKHRLDRSDWAKRNPARWAIIDVWAALVTRLGARSHEDYFADFPTITLDVDSVVELPATSQPIRRLLGSGPSHRLGGATEKENTA